MSDKHINDFEGRWQTHQVEGEHMENHLSRSEQIQIRVKDHLDTCWSEWFDGWELTVLDNGEFLLSRTMVDQSGLHGVLNKIRDLNLTLISVTRSSVKTDNP